MRLYIIPFNSNSFLACKSAFLREASPCLPDFNPIGRAFSKCNTWLRTVKVRTRQVLKEAIRTAVEWMSAHGARMGLPTAALVRADSATALMKPAATRHPAAPRSSRTNL